MSITVESTVSQVGGTQRIEANVDDPVDLIITKFLQKAGVEKADITYILRDMNGVIIKGSKKLCMTGLNEGDVVYLSTMEADRALFSYTNWWNIAGLCLFFGLGCCGVGLTMWFLSTPPPQMFGLVIDAGSVHTSIYTYVWSGEKYLGTGVVREKHYCEMGQVGISDFVDNPAGVQSYINSSCLRESLFLIPPDIKPLAILHLGSTAGMRVLRIQRPEAADNILSNLTMALSRISGIENVNVSVYEGTGEGIMGWVTANYLNNVFGDFVEESSSLENTDEHSYGALDWGGGSSQYTIQVQDTSGNYLQQFYGKDYHMLARSNLCYGQSEAMNRYRVDLVYSGFLSYNRTLPQNVTDPCSTAGDTVKLSVKSMVESPCTNTTDKAFQAATHTKRGSKKIITFIGSGDLAQCKMMTKHAFDFDYCSKRFVSLKNEDACFDSEVIPEPGNQTYLAFSTYWYVAQALNLSSESSLEDFRVKVAVLCNTPSSQLPDGACYKANFMETLLLDGYHFDKDSWGRIKFVKRVSNAEVGWTLGHMILATNDIKAVDGVAYISLPVLIALLVIAVLFFLLAIFFGYQARMINSASAKYQRFAPNP